MASFDINKYKVVQNSIPDQKRLEWNGFMDYLKSKGVAGSPQLDVKDTNLGQQLLNEYKSKNPNISLTYEDVPAIQKWFNNYRNDAWTKIQSGKAQSDAKSLDEFMPNLSPTDGWLGSKTSQTYFPKHIMNGKEVGFANVN